jgi:hypothetical protein
VTAFYEGDISLSVNKTFYFKLRQFTAGELGLAAERVCSKACSPDYSVSVSVSRKLSDGTKLDEKKDDVSLLSAICDLEKENISFHLTFAIKTKYGALTGNIITAYVFADGGVIKVSVSAATVEKLNEFSSVFASEFNLEAITENEVLQKWRSKGYMTWDDVADLADRVTALECDRAMSRRLTCFLSFRFEGRSVEYGRMVKQFLELHGVRVITGQGYEPKPVSEKVKSRLSESLDLIIVIETADGKSSWTRDEIARAQNPGIFLIPLVEEGAIFDAGIFGDHEYISFAIGHVSDAFINLIEGIQYVERIRMPVIENNANDG